MPSKRATGRRPWPGRTGRRGRHVDRRLLARLRVGLAHRAAPARSGCRGRRSPRPGRSASPDRVLGLREAAVGAGDRLEQRVPAQRLVQVHDLLDRGVEAGEQLRGDDQESPAGRRVAEPLLDLRLLPSRSARRPLPLRVRPCRCRRSSPPRPPCASPRSAMSRVNSSRRRPQLPVERDDLGLHARAGRPWRRSGRRCRRTRAAMRSGFQQQRLDVRAPCRRGTPRSSSVRSSSSAISSNASSRASWSRWKSTSRVSTWMGTRGAVGDRALHRVGVQDAAGVVRVAEQLEGVAVRVAIGVPVSPKNCAFGSAARMSSPSGPPGCGGPRRPAR